MKKILLLSMIISLTIEVNAFAISPTYSNPTAGTMDFYPLMQHQMEKQETLDFLNDSEHYKDKRSKKDAENEYRAGNKNFNPSYQSSTSLKKIYKKDKKMKFSTDSNGNIIIEDSTEN